jgi:predicted transcriptional regulator of viral defense system
MRYKTEMRQVIEPKFILIFSPNAKTFDCCCPPHCCGGTKTVAKAAAAAKDESKK